MARRQGLFARFDLDYPDHPKIVGLSDAAFRMHVEMILYSRKYKTDGVIDKRVAKRFGTRLGKPALEELLSNDDTCPSLAQLSNGDYLLHGYEDMQETRAEIDAKRLVNAENGRRGGLVKAKRTAKRSASETLSENVAETETETDTEVSTSVRSSPDVPRETDHRDEPRSGTVVPASFVLAREYLDRVPLADKARVSGVVQQAVTGGYEKAAIKAALRRLAKDSRPVTPDTLRIEIEGKGGSKTRAGEVQHLAGGVTLEIVNGTRWYRSPDGRTWAE